MPYQEDLGAALDGLREEVFRSGDWVWGTRWDDEADEEVAVPRPVSLRALDKLWDEDEHLEEEGTHSILDMRFGIVGADEEAFLRTVQPVTAGEVAQVSRGAPLTRAHVAELFSLPDKTWYGRCAVLHDGDGEPAEIYFWGFSGD